MFSMLIVGRALVVSGVTVLLAAPAVGGQAPPEQRVDIDELRATIDALVTFLVEELRSTGGAATAVSREDVSSLRRSRPRPLPA